MALPNPPWKEKLKPTITFVLPLVLLVALAGYLRVNANNNPVQFEVEANNTVTTFADTPVTLVDVTLRLNNRSSDAIDLIVDSECHILRWFLLDDAGSFIQSDPMQGCLDGAVADQVGPNATLVRTTAIPLDTRRLLEGERYHLMVRFWGYETRHRFSVEADSS